MAVINNIIDKFVNFMGDLFFCLVIMFLGFKLVNFIVSRIKKGYGFSKIEKSNQGFILSVISIGLKVIVTIIAIIVLGIPVSTIIAVIGSFGLALGLALQGGLSNIASGIMIIIFKPFKVGDFIDTHSDSGTVKEINIFHTVLMTIDNKKVILPNASLSNSTIVNYSSQDTRMLDLEISIGYKDSIDKARKILLDIADNNDLVLKDKDILVGVKEHGANAIVLVYRMWVNTKDYWKLKLKVLEEVKKEFDKNKISIPYNQIDVHIEK